MAHDKGVIFDDWARAPTKPSGSQWSRCGNFIYNYEKKSFLGRTSKEWGVILLFYTVFYAGLAALTTICVLGMLATIDENRPKWTLDESRIGANPGLAMRPRAANFDPIIAYKVDDAASYANYTDELRTFLKPYQNKLLIPMTGACSVAENFGYPDNPCVYIKLNKIYNWVPQYYDAASLPSDIPIDLKEHIQSLDGDKKNQIWVSCAAEGTAKGFEVTYPWSRGLPSHFYPFLSDKTYLSPLVAVQFKSIANIETMIRCRAWAKNVVYNKSIKDPSGYTRFFIHIESNKESETTKDNATLQLNNTSDV